MTQKRALQVIAACITAITIAGCSPSFMTGGRDEFNPDNAKKIVVGTTTKQQVVELLGPASNTQVLGDTDIFIYKNFTQTKGWVPGHIKEQKSEHLHVTMKNNMVVDCKISARDMNVGMYYGSQQVRERRCNE